MRRKHIITIFLMLPFLFQTAWAEENHGTPLMDFLGKTINFIVLFGGLAYLLAKPLRRFLEQRAGKIERSLREAENSRREAEKKLQQAKNRLDRLDEEVKKITEEGEMEGEKRKERRMEEALREAEKIRNFAKDEIEMLTRAGIRELKEYTAELATEMARKKIEKRMTEELQSSMIERSLGKLEEFYEESSSH
ncbi:MAG: hypothetical protein ACLFVG_09565 [Candidatus Aminicenantes bacterium]